MGENEFGSFLPVVLGLNEGIEETLGALLGEPDLEMLGDRLGCSEGESEVVIVGTVDGAVDGA